MGNDLVERLNKGCILAQDGLGGVDMNATDALCQEAAARILALEEALKIAEQADQQHINCPECEGEGQAEECGTCYPLADEARLARWAALGINQKESAKVLPLRRAARAYANKGEPT